MKKVLIGLLVLGMAIPAYSGVTPTAQVVNSAVIADMNKPIETTSKITTGSWIWIGFIVVVSIVAGTVTYNTKQPI